MARTDEGRCRRCSLEREIGAAQQRFVVKSAAALHASSARRSIRSVRSLYFMPAATAPEEKPVGQNAWVPSDSADMGVTDAGQEVLAESSRMTLSPLYSFSNAVCSVSG